MYRRKRTNAFILTVLSGIALVAAVLGTAKAEWRSAEDSVDFVTEVAKVAACFLMFGVALTCARLEAAAAKRLAKQGESEPVDVVSEARAQVGEYMRVKNKAGLVGAVEQGAKYLRGRSKRES